MGPIFKQRAHLDTFHGYAIQDFLDVGNDVENHPQSFGVRGSDQIDQIPPGAKFFARIPRRLKTIVQRESPPLDALNEWASALSP